MERDSPSAQAQSDIKNLFSHLPMQHDRFDYRELREHRPVTEILGRWPLLAEMHALSDSAS